MAGIAPVMSPSGRHVFFDETPRGGRVVWSVADSATTKLPDVRERVQGAAFSDDDSLIVVAYEGGRISLVNPITGVQRRSEYRYGAGSDVAVLAVAPHTHTVAVSYGDTVILIKDNSVVGVKRDLEGASVWDMKFSADGSSLLLVDDMGGAEIAQLDARTSTRSDSLNFQIDNGGRDVTASAISAQGTFLAIATDDRVIWIFDTRDTLGMSPRSEIKGLEGTTVQLTFGANERTLVATGGDGDIHIWQLTNTGALAKDLAPLVLQHTPKVPHQRHLPFANTVLSPDGKTLTSVVTPEAGTPRIGKWDLDYPRISKRLLRTTTACLDVIVRKQLLPNETENERLERTAACEVRAGRTK